MSSEQRLRSNLSHAICMCRAVLEVGRWLVRQAEDETSCREGVCAFLLQPLSSTSPHPLSRSCLDYTSLVSVSSQTQFTTMVVREFEATCSDLY